METLKNVKALICIGKFDSAQIKSFESLCPHVLFVDMQTSRIHCNTISLDFHQAIIDVLDYLTDLGHKKIAYFGGQEVLPDQTIYSDDRKHTFISYCKEHNIIFEPYLKEEGYQTEAGYMMAIEMIESGDLPTALFAASDPIAIGALKAFREKGIRIPEDISVIGFDDIELASYTIPALTTVKAPTEFMGEYAAHYITMLCRNTELEYRTPVRLMLPCELIVRDSCTSIK